MKPTTATPWFVPLPPPGGDRRLIWIGLDRYEQLVRAAADRGVSVDDLVEQLLAGVGDPRS